MVGTIASRWAREAISGHDTRRSGRASSTLEATASASSVVPRTMPTPVSSQEVSMPSTSGSSAIALGSLYWFLPECWALLSRVASRMTSASTFPGW